MLKIIILQGLPGSGKSTYAKSLVTEYPNTYKRINRDDLRMMFDNGITSKGNEKFVKKVRDILIVQTLSEGKHVIVDDTNLSERNIVRIQQIAADFTKKTAIRVQVDIKRMDTPLAECIARDAKRTKPVGEQVIRAMHRQFFDNNERYITQNEALPKAIICDLDGTLALLNGRNPYIATHCEQDALNTPIANLLALHQQNDFQILLVSGRLDTYRAATERWLVKHNIHYDALLMRVAGDSRKDSIVKKEIFEVHIANKYHVAFILDDRNQVVNMWRDELKLPCFQVYYGDF